MATTARNMTPQAAARRRASARDGSADIHRGPLAERARRARSRPQVLHAAGARIERTTSEQMRAIAGQRERWQSLAWGYRDMIGELRGALQFRAQAISRVRFFVAQIIDDEDEPVALAARNETDSDGKPTERAEQVTLSPALCQAAEDELARLPLDAGDSFLGVWSENFDVAGECWLHGYRHQDTDEETWEIRSVDDVDVQGSNVTIKDALGQPKTVNLSPDSGEELYRMWRKHPRHPHRSDSALNACLDSLEDITLIGREMRAASRSRIAANGILWIPAGFADLKNTKEDDDRSPRDRFMADLTASIVSPISNEGDAGGIAPIVIMGDKDDIKAVRHDRLEREDSPALIAKLNKALARMGQSIEVPPEIITGMADVNHWTAWQIDTSTFRYYLEPGIRLMADSLTQCFIRPALKGFPPEEVRRVRVWFDAGSITENPNRQADTILALDHMLISGRTGRQELGFGEQDAPSPEEVLQMIAAKNGFDTATAAKILMYMADQNGAQSLPELDPADVPEQRQIAPPPAEPPQDPTGIGGTGEPDAVPLPGVNAAGELTWKGVLDFYRRQHYAVTGTRLSGPGYPENAFGDTQGNPERAQGDFIPKWTLDSVLGHQLADIERALRDRILLAADAALARALTRAGNRLRSKTQKNPDLFTSLRLQPTTTWAKAMGREQAFALGADLRFLLKEAFTELGSNFATWVNNAVNALIDRVLRFLGIKPGSAARDATANRMRAAMQGRTDAAWSRLEDALEKRAEQLLFDGEGEPLADGEQSTLSVPVDAVRVALAMIGGLPETAGGVDDTGRIPTGEPFTGLADGTTILAELDAHGVVPFGREWQYNPTLERNTFLPHYDLDGERFTSWTDEKLKAPPEYAWVGAYFRPKDHLGCLCTTAVTYAVPDLEGRQAAIQAIDDDPSAALVNAHAWEAALADQLRERLRQPSQDMAYIIELAESDDRAGRRFTVAQQTRDQYLEVQRLKNQFLNGE